VTILSSFQNLSHQLKTFLSNLLKDLEQWFSKWPISTPRGQFDHPRGRLIVKGLNGGHWMARGQWKTAGVYWRCEASNSKLLLTGQGMQTTFFNKSNKIKRAEQISATVV